MHAATCKCIRQACGTPAAECYQIIKSFIHFWLLQTGLIQPTACVYTVALSVSTVTLNPADRVPSDISTYMYPVQVIHVSPA